MSGSTAMPTKCSRPPAPYNFLRFRSLKINHVSVKSPRQISRTELISERRGSADVVPFRSSYRVPPTPSSQPRQTACSPRGTQPCRSARGGARGLHPRLRRQTGPVWTGGVLDRGRYGDDAWPVVGGDGNLFRIS